MCGIVENFENELINEVFTFCMLEGYMGEDISHVCVCAGGGEFNRLIIYVLLLITYILYCYFTVDLNRAKNKIFEYFKLQIMEFSLKGY